jgi:hypothetical protein
MYKYSKNYLYNLLGYYSDGTNGEKQWEQPCSTCGTVYLSWYQLKFRALEQIFYIDDEMVASVLQSAVQYS